MSKHKGNLWLRVKPVVMRIVFIWLGLWLAGILLFRSFLSPFQP
ncbi:hypothetical protein WDV93_05575 [Pantoea ananatis]